MLASNPPESTAAPCVLPGPRSTKTAPFIHPLQQPMKPDFARVCVAAPRLHPNSPPGAEPPTLSRAHLPSSPTALSMANATPWMYLRNGAAAASDNCGDSFFSISEHRQSP